MRGAAFRTRRQYDVRLEPEQFRALARIARQDAGLTIPEGKAGMVQSRLARRLRVVGLDGFDAYLALVESTGGAEERRELISALTTNVTQFFRERHHFETLRNEVLPPLVARAQTGGRVRLWSAGCSTGQEAFSIACEVIRLAPRAPRFDIRILATDIDRNVLRRAREGRYPSTVFTGLSPDDIASLSGAAGARSGETVIRPELRDLVTFRELNLLGPWPIRGAFDAIFCRNVVIYFDAEAQRRLWPRFEAALAPGGWLFLGHSERLNGDAAPGMANVGVTTYRRLSVAPREETR
jgi:chemotaxis protein methyltransferase CheR